jgi:hypothetical protein
MTCRAVLLVVVGRYTQHPANNIMLASTEANINKHKG